jgi:hypothetical protein
MYTGTLIDDLIAAVEKAERLVKAHSHHKDPAPDSSGKIGQNAVEPGEPIAVAKPRPT